MRNKSILAAFMVFLIFTRPALADRLAPGQPLVFTMPEGVPAFYKQFNSLLLAALSRRLNLTFELQEYPAERALFYANVGGRAVGTTLRMAGHEKLYQNLVMVPVRLVNFELVAYIRDDSKFSITGWDSLGSLVVSVQRGNKLAEQFTAGMNVEYVETVEQSFQKLAAGRVDVVIDSREAKCTPLTLGLDHILAVNLPLETIPLYHYINKNNAHTLLPLMTKALNEMKDQGVVEQLYKTAMATFLNSCQMSVSGAAQIAPY